jgi:starvation-inducible DNA-binding protein
MDTQQLQLILEETFATNFVMYYKAHQAHVNITGRNFMQDHKHLKSVYEKLQDMIDVLGEKLRGIKGTMPTRLSDIISLSAIDDKDLSGESEEILQGVLVGLEVLLDQFKELNECAEECNYPDVENMSQDMIDKVAKMIWQLRATLDCD